MTRMIFCLVTALGVAGCGEADGDGDDGPIVQGDLAEGAVECLPRPGESRWMPTSGEYTAVREYGRDESDWLGAVAGIAKAGDGRLFVFDMMKSHVIVLSPSLTRVGQFGRQGEGPGEFSSFPILVRFTRGADWIEVVDSLVYVYDLARLGRFTLDGEFREYVPGVPTGILAALSVRKLRAGPGRLLFPFDVWPVHQNLSAAAAPGRRTFQILELSEDSARVVFELPLTPLPLSPRGLISFSSRQAHPLWDVYEGCAFVSDGETDRMLRHGLASGVTDTLMLPRHDVRGPDAEEMERTRRASEASRRAAGADGSAATEMPTWTALMRWDRLAVDPDGRLWIRPWQEPSEREGRSFMVDIVNVATGEARAVTVPAFPEVFGEPGTFYAVEKDPDTDIDIITRYDLRGSPGGEREDR